MANTTQNPTIVALYKSLCSQQDAISDALSKCTDPDVAASLSLENSEIMHRIVLAQNLLFQADSTELQQDVQAVTASSTELTTALANIKEVTGIITAVSSYLTLVDEAIDLAKTL